MARRTTRGGAASPSSPRSPVASASAAMPDSGVSADSDVRRVTFPDKLKNWAGDWEDIFDGGHAAWTKADKVAKEVSLSLSLSLSLFSLPLHFISLSLSPSLSRPSPPRARFHCFCDL